ncbi:MAG: M20/M25/M40 family metallo-hydrolase [Clostridia bacterium]|nr:M20/M25/M40 family metallo-hydrolase [Clostridia bacterium]
MELLKKLTNTFGVSGSETDITNVIKSELSGLGEISVSHMGNLTLHIPGKGKKVLFAAHMDEIGIMARFIDDNGFIYFSAVGGISPATILNTRVRFENGVCGVVSAGEKKEIKDLKITDMFIDVGAKDKSDAEEKIPLGICGRFESAFEISGKTLISRSLDNRAGCWALIKAAKQLKNTSCDVYMVFTAQEEIGLRGAATAAYDICPDYAIAVDITDTGDTPDCEKMAVKLGLGPCIKIMDKGIVTNHEIREIIAEAACSVSIPVQQEILTAGKTDATYLQYSCGGIKTGAISIPLRYIHTPHEMANSEDLQNTVDLICAICKKIM